MNNWHYIVSFAFLLAVFLTWKEFKRINRSRLGLRLLSSVLALASLVSLVISSTHKEKGHHHDEWVLLTDGFSTDSVSSFLQNHPEEIPVYFMDKNLAEQTKKFHSKWMNDPVLIPNEEKPSLIHLFGEGLNKSDLQSLGPASVVFHAPATPYAGFSAAGWLPAVQAGDPFIVQGKFENPFAGPIKLSLKGISATEDSVFVSGGKNTEFELVANPKLIGRTLYQLIAVSGRDTLANEPVPVEIKAPQSFQILLLASSPGFENKFLKNWLSQKGYELTVRTTTSKNKYNRQFLNVPKSNAETITPAYLDKFRLVIANGGELAAISKNELEAIRMQVESKGLGLLVRTDSGENKTSFYSKNFPVYHTKRPAPQSIIISNKESDTTHFTLPMENPLCIKFVQGTQALIHDSHSEIVASRELYGSGIIEVTSIGETYSLVLSGNMRDYADLWSLLLQKASGTTSSVASWRSSPATGYPDEPTQLDLETDDTGLPKAKADQSDFYLRQNSLLPFQWQGTFWPQHTGWQHADASQQSSYYWYTYNKRDWKKTTALQKTNDTKEYVSSHPVILKGYQTSATEILVKLRLYFFLLFILCCGFLWAEQKI